MSRRRTIRAGASPDEAHKPLRYRDLTPSEYDKLYRTGFRLHELLETGGEDRIEDLVIELSRRARIRIVGVFKEAEEKSRGRSRKTDNYIKAARGEQPALVAYVHTRIRNSFIKSTDLSWKFQNLWPDHLERIRIQAERQILILTIDQMAAPRGAELWYEEKLQVWQLAQSCIDEIRLDRKRTRTAINRLKGYFDSRTYHGRNGKQARPRDKQNRNAYRSTGFSTQVK